MVVGDACYAVISDENYVLSLEEILDRLNLNPKYRIVRCGNGFSSPCERLNEFNEEERKKSEFLGWCQGHEEENDKRQYILLIDGIWLGMSRGGMSNLLIINFFF